MKKSPAHRDYRRQQTERQARLLDALEHGDWARAERLRLAGGQVFTQAGWERCILHPQGTSILTWLRQHPPLKLMAGEDRPAPGFSLTDVKDLASLTAKVAWQPDRNVGQAWWAMIADFPFDYGFGFPKSLLREDLLKIVIFSPDPYAYLDASACWQMVLADPVTPLMTSAQAGLVEKLACWKQAGLRLTAEPGRQAHPALVALFSHRKAFETSAFLDVLDQLMALGVDLDVPRKHLDRSTPGTTYLDYSRPFVRLRALAAQPAPAASRPRRRS